MSQDRVDMVVNSSLILALDHNIPRLQVDNPDLLTVTPLSATQVQLHAKKTGITNVSLWDDKNQIYTVEVSITGECQGTERTAQGSVSRRRADRNGRLRPV